MAPRLHLLAQPGSRRVLLFQEALARRGDAPAHGISWAEWLRGEVRLDRVVRPGDVLRLDSPSRDFDVEKLLLALGGESAELENSSRLTSRELDELPFDRGRILHPRQWFLGLRSALRRLEEEVSAVPGVVLTHAPGEILCMFDKPATHGLFSSRGIPVPRSLGSVSGYDDLAARMRSENVCRVFVKLAHGSSASGVVAYQVNGHRHQAVTTVEVGARGFLYNSRRLRTLRDATAIARLVDVLASYRLHVEQWFPKSAMEGRTCDIRLLCVAGRPWHGLVRLSRTPVTNLHLLNGRADLARLWDRVPPATRDGVLQSATLAADCFPRSLQVALDVAISPDDRRHCLLEANAFGDFLPGLVRDGRDAYTAQLGALDAGWVPPRMSLSVTPAVRSAS